MRKSLLICVALLCCQLAFGQNTDRYGLRLQIKSKITTSSPWNVKVGLESRQIFKELQHGTEKWLDYRYERTSLSILPGIKLSSGATIHAGYMIRRIEGKWVQRAIQQYAWGWESNVWEWGFRISFDETFYHDDNPKFRLRYRIDAERPLKGREMKDNSWYLTWSHEQMPVLKAGEFVYEGRVTFAFGYLFPNSDKFETGIEGRLSDIGLSRMEYQLWWTNTYSFKL